MPGTRLASRRAQQKETEEKEEKVPAVPPPPPRYSPRFPLSLSDSNQPDIQHSDYDTESDTDGKENNNPIDSLLTAVRQSRHHRGKRG